jgi:REP element-mobilizing transposase RayT
MDPSDDRCRYYRRRSSRLRGCDYGRPGFYFVTVCTRDRLPLFGDVADGTMHLNPAGQAARACWLEIPAHFPGALLDAFVVMPNHVHGIIAITAGSAGVTDAGAGGAGGAVGANNYSPLHNAPMPKTPIQLSKQRPNPPRSPSKTIGSVVRGFKIGVTKWMRANTVIRDVWQRNYHEHVIRDD